MFSDRSQSHSVPVTRISVFRPRLRIGSRVALSVAAPAGWASRRCSVFGDAAKVKVGTAPLAAYRSHSQTFTCSSASAETSLSPTWLVTFQVTLVSFMIMRITWSGILQFCCREPPWGCAVFPPRCRPCLLPPKGGFDSASRIACAGRTLATLVQRGATCLSLCGALHENMHNLLHSLSCNIDAPKPMFAT